MTLEEVNAAINKLKNLREKIVALETGKYYDLDLSEDQKKKLNDEVNIIKGDLKTSADSITIGTTIEVKPSDGIKDNMKVDKLPKIKEK